MEMIRKREFWKASEQRRNRRTNKKKKSGTKKKGKKIEGIEVFFYFFPFCFSKRKKIEENWKLKEYR